MSSTNDFARELFAKIDSWTKTNKPIYVLTESTMVDDLELAVLKHLSKKNGKPDRSGNKHDLRHDAGEDGHQGNDGQRPCIQQAAAHERA